MRSVVNASTWLRTAAQATLCLVATSVANAQSGSDGDAADGAAPTLDAELLCAHPAYVSGDDAALVADLLAALESQPSAPLAIEALHVLAWHRAELGPGEVRRLLALAGRLADAEAAFQALRLVSMFVREDLYSDEPLRMGEATLAGRFVRQWFVVGPLGELDHPAPAAMDAPVSSPELIGAPDAAQYIGTDGVLRPWRSCALPSGELWAVTPSDHVYPGGGVTYAVAFVDARESIDHALLEIRTSGALRAWWNGAPVLDERRDSRFVTETRHLADVEVHPGWNVLLVRLVTSEQASLGARLLDEHGVALALDDAPRRDDGAPLDVWSVPWQRATTLPVSLPSQRLGAEDESGVFGPALEITRALIASRADLALAVTMPDDSRGRAAVRYARLAALASVGHLPDEMRRREVLGLLDTLESEGPLFSNARMTRVQVLLRDDRPAEALEQAEAWIEATPDLLLPRLARAWSLRQLDRQGVLWRIALEELRLAYPEALDVQTLLTEARSSVGDEVGANELAWSVLQRDATSGRSFDLVVELAARARDRARLEFLLDRTRLAAAERPDDDLRDRERVLLSLLDRPAERIATFELAVEQSPMQSHVHWQLGSELLRRGDLDRAKAAFSQELALDPGDATTRETMRLLGEEDPAERFFAEFEPELAEALARAEHVTDASVVEALDSGLVYFFPNGDSHARFQSISIPRDRSGTEALHVRAVEEDTRSARILTRDGRQLEPVEVDGEWTLPALEPGDRVEFVWDAYREGVPGSVPGEYGWSFSSFEKAFPTSRWVVYVPSDLPGRLEVRNFKGERRAVPYAGGTVHVLTASSPRLIEEPARPSDAEVLPGAAYGDDRERHGELQALSGELVGLSELTADIEPDVRAFIAQHAGADPSADLRVAARALYDALEARTPERRGGAGATDVWLTERGLTLFLLGALYERAGVPFEWAFLERGVAPELDPEPVTMFDNQRRLERAAMRLGLLDDAGDPIWIVPTGATGLPFGALPQVMAGAAAIVLDKRRGGWREDALPRTQIETAWDADIALTYRLAADGSAVVEGRFTDSTANGAQLRRQLSDATREQRDAFARQRAGAVARGVDLDAADFDLEAENPGAVLVFKGRAPRFIARRGDQWLADPPLLPLGLDTAFGPAQRNWPLAVRASTRIRVNVSLELGEVWRVLGGPETLREEREGLLVEVGHDYDETTARCAVSQVLDRRGLFVEAEEMPAFVSRMGLFEAEFRRALRFERRE